MTSRLAALDLVIDNGPCGPGLKVAEAHDPPSTRISDVRWLFQHEESLTSRSGVCGSADSSVVADPSP